MNLWARLDAYGADDPDFNEPQLEDICPLSFCGRRVVDHPGRQRFGLGDGSAKWPHRRAALLSLLIDRLSRR